jgi:SAM-dependent methyltransferase
MRGRFEGVRNIVRFNRRLYGAAALASATLGAAAAVAAAPWGPWCAVAAAAVAAQAAVSLLVSHHVYDRSGLYELRWLDGLAAPPRSIVAITAGFDETSAALRDRYPQAAVQVLDFYDARRHTEPSLRIARAASAPMPGTVAVASTDLPVATGSADLIVCVFAAHEIRDAAERAAFLRELRRILRPDGAVVVVEHLRDLANVLAYSVGALHFHSRATWLRAFGAAGLALEKAVACTPFASAFILRPHGPAPASAA